MNSINLLYTIPGIYYLCMIDVCNFHEFITCNGHSWIIVIITYGWRSDQDSFQIQDVSLVSISTAVTAL